MAIFSFIGMPLSGKTKLISEITKEVDIPVLSTGELARSLGMKKEESIKSKDISMDLNDIIIDKVLIFINENENCILDGFPRSEEQIKLLMSRDIEVIFVQANPLEIYERAIKRGRDENDVPEIVSGRCEASMRLKYLAMDYVGNVKVFYSDENFDISKNAVIKYVKERMQ